MTIIITVLFVPRGYLLMSVYIIIISTHIYIYMQRHRYICISKHWEKGFMDTFCHIGDWGNKTVEMMMT